MRAKTDLFLARNRADSLTPILVAIVSNLCFDARALTEWVRRVRRRGVPLPIQLGLAGPVERAKLLAMATKIGVGESTRFLGKHPAWFARLAAGYAPERLLGKVSADLSPTDLVAGLHIFTFNQVAETEAWRQGLLARLDSAAHAS